MLYKMTPKKRQNVLPILAWGFPYSSHITWPWKGCCQNHDLQDRPTLHQFCHVQNQLIIYQSGSRATIHWKDFDIVHIGRLNRPTFYEICKKKTTGGYSALPYVATLLNCMLWTFYGAPAVAGLIFVVSINVAGLILETIYVFIHFLFGNKIGRVHFHILLPSLAITVAFCILNR